MKFTKAAVAALVLPAGKDEYTAWCDETPGFGLRLRAGGSKVWIAQYRLRNSSKQQKTTLGKFPKVLPEDARRAASRIFAQVALGVDPHAERVKARVAAAAASLTVGSVADKYLAVKEAMHRPNTHVAARRYLTKHWRPLRDRPLDSIKRADVAALLHDLTKVHGQVAASRARSQLSALFSWAMKEGLCEANPVIATNVPDAGVKPRERVLSLAELAVVWRACRDDSLGRIVKLLTLTGARRMEIGQLRWSEVNLDAGVLTIPGERVKNGRTLTLPLAPAAIDILRSVQRLEGRPYVFGRTGEGFGSWSSVTTDLRLRIMAATGGELPAFSLHDLRRSAATHMAELGVAPHVVEQILNHQSGSKRGIAGIYNPASYAAEVRSALARWAETLLAAVENQESKVTPLRRA